MGWTGIDLNEIYEKNKNTIESGIKHYYDMTNTKHILKLISIGIHQLNNGTYSENEKAVFFLIYYMSLGLKFDEIAGKEYEADIYNMYRNNPQEAINSLYDFITSKLSELPFGKKHHKKSKKHHKKRSRKHKK